MFSLRAQISEEQMHEFCVKHHIKRLSLFGSALRDELGPESDIDLLIEFKENHTPGLLTFAKIESELTDMLGRHVDLRTPAELSRYFRNEVMATARVEYAA